MDALRPLLTPITKQTDDEESLKLKTRPSSASILKKVVKVASIGSLRQNDQLISPNLRKKSSLRRHNSCASITSTDDPRRRPEDESFQDALPVDNDPTLSNTRNILKDIHGKPIAGIKYSKGAMTHLKFTSVEIPESDLHPNDMRLVSKYAAKCHNSLDVRCGFCHANNMLWHLRCAFCGCCRVSDVPRMHYIVNMILSVDPGISAAKVGAFFDQLLDTSQLAHDLLKYAKFDSTAMDAERNFKQASLVRSKAAMVLMSKTTDRLRWHIVRMIFMAWKKVRSEALRSEETMARLIKIKEMQTQGRLKSQVFSNWKNLTMVKWDERFAKLSIASERKIQSTKRFIWSRWMQYYLGRLRERCAYLKDIMMSNQDLLSTKSTEEFDQAKKLVHDLKEALVATVDQSMSMSESLTSHLQDSMQEIVHVQNMLPSTAGYLLGVSNLSSIVNGFLEGQIDLIESYNHTKHDHEFTQTALDAIQDRVGRFIPWDTLIQWLNIQIHYIHNQLKRKIFPPFTSLQDVRGSMSSPKFVLHLLWHFAPISKNDYDTFYTEECEKDPLLALSPNSATNRHVQWKIFLKAAHERIYLPQEVASRDELMGGSFDAYYCILLYFFAIYSDAAEPLQGGTGIFPFLQTWPALKDSMLVTNMYDTDASLRVACQELIRRLRTLQESQIKLLGIHRQLQHVLAMHRHAVLRGNVSDFCRRLRGRESTVAIALEREELSPHVRLDYNRISNFCTLDEFALIEALYQENAVPLIHIFRACGASNAGKSMGEHEFYKLMSQCGIIERKNMTRAYLQLIVQASNVPPEGVDPSIDRYGDLELTSNEFMEALTRVAFHLHEKRPTTPLVDIVKELVDVRLFPVATAIEKQGIGSFKRQLRQQDVQAVLRSHDKKLKRLFAFHASEKRGKFITLSEFEGWLKEQHLIDALFPYPKIKQIFYSVQQDTNDGGDIDLELIFAEFVEAIAAVAVFRNPNPYTSLANRLETFLNDNL